MDSDGLCEIDTAEQFWAGMFLDCTSVGYTVVDMVLEIDRVLASPCFSPESIDDCLRCYLALAIKHKGTREPFVFAALFGCGSDLAVDDYLSSDEDVGQFAHKLRISPVFVHQENYVRRQFVYGLLQEDDGPTLHIFAGVILFDGRENEATFQMMKEEGVFPRLVELIQTFGLDMEYTGLNKLFLELIYEMARILTLDWNDLAAVDDSFVLTLLSLTEHVSSDAADPYHYCVIRVLLVINEQYMVASSQLPRPGEPPKPPLTNRVLKAISTHASVYKTFGENLILLLNREKEAILQIQILKLLYLVFGTRSTAEYFYTNDLHVLLDVILRNLLDLPTDDDIDPSQFGTPGMTQALRHTYLRVLHHLLENSQLQRPGMAYKPVEITAVLDLLAGRRTGNALHFAPLDETTLRLAERCRSVTWLREGSGRASPPPTIDIVLAPSDAQGDVETPNALDGPAGGYEEVARRRLGMSVQEATGSSLSMVEVATHTEKPGLITPSRGLGNNNGNGTVTTSAVDGED